MNRPHTGPRYIAKSQHGVWQVFDTIYYGVVGFGLTKRAAEDRADQLNARKAPAQAVRR